MRCDSSACEQQRWRIQALALEDGRMKPVGGLYVTSCDAEALRHASHLNGGAPIRGATRHSTLAYRHVMLVDRPWLGAFVAQLCSAVVAEPAIFILFTPYIGELVNPPIISYPVGNVHSRPEISFLRGNATRSWRAHRRGGLLTRILCSLLCIDGSPQQLVCCWPCRTSKRFFWAAGTPVRSQSPPPNNMIADF
jgi:hypothetical protein